MWHDVGIKSSQNFPKVLLKELHSSKQYDKFPNIWTNIERKICHQNSSKITQSDHTEADVKR